MKYFNLGKIFFVLALLFSPILQAEDAYEIEWIDQYGSILTTNTGGVYPRTDHGESVATDSSGNIYVTGDVGGGLDGNVHNDGTQDMFISKYNATGIRLWSSLLGGSTNDYGKSVAIDNNDNIYVTGYTYDALPGHTSNGNLDAFLVKYNTDGVLLWSRQFGTSNAEWVGAVTTDNNGDIYVTGRISGTYTGFNDQIYIAKYDTNGNAQWTSQFSSIDPNYWVVDQVTSITTDSNGDVYVAGFTDDVFPGNVELGTSYADAFLAKYNSLGNVIWIKQFGTTREDQAFSVTVGKFGFEERIYVAGATAGCLKDWWDCGDGYDSFLFAFNQNGTELWNEQFGVRTKGDVAHSVATDDSGSIYVTGTVTDWWGYGTWGASTIFRGYTDVYVIKFASSGAFTWYTGFGARYVDIPKSITVDNSGNIYVTGTTDSILASPTSYDTSPGYDDIFLAKLAIAGATNIAPIADAGADDSVAIGTLATLNGGNSNDPDENYPLTFAWSFTSVPFGSEIPTLDDVVDPTFTPFVPGSYVLSLVVTDALGVSSSPDSVTINTYNTPPFADAGPDQAFTFISSLVSLDGSGSYDEDGDELSYIWSFEQKPAGSSAGFDNPYAVDTTFIADINGDYHIVLTVTDIWGAADTDDLLIGFSNVAPVADAGANQSSVVGETVLLNGSGSSDANGDSITYNWGLSTVPEGSTAIITDPLSVEPSFTPDLSGTYIASLVVNDGTADSAADSAEIVVVSFNTLTTQTVSETIVLINETPVESFRNLNLGNALTNKLNAVLKMISNEQYEQAWNKLTTDILPKTDGCAFYGTPDKKDWIKTCEEQEAIYNYILETIVLLEMKL